MSQRVELLALMEKLDSEAIMHFVKNSRDLGDTVAEFSQRNREDMWESLRRMCTDVLLDDRVEEDEDQQALKKAKHHAFLDCVVTLAAATLQQKDAVLPQELVDTGALLHGVLLTLPDEIEAVKYRLAQLFESWWRQNLPGWEDVIANTFVYLLKRSLEKSTVTDMKTVWRMHSVLTLINLEAPSSANLKHLLGRCCASAHYIKSEEGRRFLGYIFTLNSGLVDSLHCAIKNQIPYAPKSWLSLYGDVYFRAWRKSTGDICQKIENDCIQDLMNHAIHASREGPQPISSSLFRVLNQFHRQKKQRGVDAMLLRLYNPILWRALTMPNTEVRANSASLMLDAFPLQDPSTTAEDTDLLIQKQFDLMQRLLVDPCPTVRTLTAEGVCRILSDYLEMTPAEVVQSLLCRLLKELAWDTAAPSVRLAVVKGMTAMLDNPLCHGLLKPLLPSLSMCLHDKAETVRIAMVDLLLKVKAIRSIKYWNITPVEHLLVRMEVDSQPVVRRLVELLFSSFLPLEHSDQEQVSRCITLLQSSPGAARIFFLHCPQHLTLTDTVKYMSLLCRYVLESVRLMHQSLDNSDHETSRDRTQRRAGKRGRQGMAQESREREENSDEDDINDEDGLSAEILQGLLEAIFLMWTAVANQLNTVENTDLKQSIMKKLSVTIPEVLKVSQDPKVISLVVEIAGHLPPKAVPTISRSCLSKLRNLPEDSGEDCTELLEAMCLWEMAPQVLQLLMDWLQDSFLPTPSPSATEKKTDQKSGKKRVQIAVPEEKKRPELALGYLKVMLRSAVCRRVLIRDHHSLLTSLNNLLSEVKVMLERQLEKEGTSSPETSVFLETAFSMHLRLTVLLHDPEEEVDCVVYMKEMLRWADQMMHCLPAPGDRAGFGNHGVRERDLGSVHLVTACVKGLLTMHRNMLMLGMGDKELVTQLLSFCGQVLCTDCRLTSVEEVLGCVHQLLLFEELEATEPVSHSMGHLMDTLTSCLRLSTPDIKVMNSVKNKIVSIISFVLSHHHHPPRSSEKDIAIVTELTNTMLSTVLSELQFASEQGKLTAQVEEDQEPLPSVSTCVLTCYSRNTPCRRLFVQEMERFVKSGAVTDVHMVHGIVHLLLTIQAKGRYHREVDVSSLQTAVSSLVQSLCDQPADSLHMEEDVFRDMMQTVQTKLQTALGES